MEQMLDTPRSLGIPVTDKRVEIFFTRQDQERIEWLLQEGGLGSRDAIVHIHPTSRWLFKCWRDEGMSRVIDRLEETGKVEVVLTSGNEERERKKIDVDPCLLPNPADQSFRENDPETACGP